MAISRLVNLLPAAREHPVLVLYGPGVKDVFIDANGQGLPFETAFEQNLEMGGWTRVFIHAPHRRLARKGAACLATVAAPEGGSGQMAFLTGGPLGQRMLLETQCTAIDSPPMGDAHTLRQMDTLLRQSESGTALLLLQAETTLRFFEAPRLLAGLLADWMELPAENHNRCWLVFSARNEEELQEQAGRLPSPELRSAILAKSGLVYLDGPDEEELKTLCLAAADRKGQALAGGEAARMAMWMAAEDGLAREWQTRLESLSRIDPISLKQAGWLAAGMDERPPLDRLNDWVGLAAFRQRMLELADWLTLPQTTRTRPLLHMIFSGNPGTGKTTAARLTGELLHDLGWLRRGHLVEVRAAELVADHVGGTAIKTRAAVERARGGVLFIDEAYALTQAERGGFGAEALETLLPYLEDAGTDLVVIAAGYPKEMDEFLRSNPGLGRRFPLENRFLFPDFSPAELLDIFKYMAAQQGVSCSAELETMLAVFYDRLVSDHSPDFGNAGEVRNLLEAALRRRAGRIRREKTDLQTPLLVEDLPSGTSAVLQAGNPVEVDAALNGLGQLAGLAEVKAFLRGQVELARYEHLRGQPRAHPESRHLLFVGPPGTGKTTAARLVGQLYHGMGWLRRGHCVEVSRADLVAPYVGQTAQRVVRAVERALDGVLFIDEAYSLCRGGAEDFGTEALDALVKAMEDHRGRLVLVAAGYEQEMEVFLRANSGLESRFAMMVHFEALTGEEMGDLLAAIAGREGFELGAGVQDAAVEALLADKDACANRFGNGRAVRRLFAAMKQALACRVLGGHGKMSVRFEVEDVHMPQLSGSRLKMSRQQFSL